MGGQNFPIFISCRDLVELGPQQLGLPAADGLINHVLTVLLSPVLSAGGAPPPEVHPGASECAPGLAFAFIRAELKVTHLR